MRLRICGDPWNFANCMAIGGVATGLTGRDKMKGRGLWTAVFLCPTLQAIS